MQTNSNMNNAAFSSFYSSVAFQQPELSTPIHTVEHEHDNFSNLANNCNFFDDEQEFLSNGEALSNAVVAAHKTPPHATTNYNNNNIPFVQIHTTDLQQQAQQGNGYRNVFRRKTAEIKSEPIKSEQAEASKERTNATPTPPTRNSSCASSEGKTNGEEASGTGGDGVAASQDLPALHKCPSCPFASLSQLKAQGHIANCFGMDAQRRLQCPGCANIFYNVNALNVHLNEDHLLESHEISTLLFALNQGKIGSIPNNNKKQNEQQQQQQVQEQQQRKSRIFIKNVNCLREPQREDLTALTDYMLSQECVSSSTNNNNSIIDLFDTVTDNEAAIQKHPNVTEAQVPSQKISIKSVDVLREPALLPFEFQLPGCDEQQLPMNAEGDLDVQVVGMEQEKPRAPKIYIRNVDILKEPMLLPSALSFDDAAASAVAVASPGDVFQSGAELLTPSTALPGFEPSLANICTEVFPFDSVLSGGGSALDAFAVTASNSSSTASSNSNLSVGGGSFVMDRFSALDLDFGVDFEHSVPLAAETTSTSALASTGDLEPSSELVAQADHFLPATAPAQKQKIFIKNVDILKAPQFQQRHEQHQQRGTLHLRTVDELNLMNRIEVEHLIAPNMEHILDLPVASVGDFRPQEQPQALDNSWPNSGYDLADDLDCIIINTMAPLLPVAGEVEDALQLSNEPLPVESAELDTLTQMAEDILIDDFSQLYATQSESSSLKHEWPADAHGLPPASPLPTDSSLVVCAPEVPPLAPVTATVTATATSSAKGPAATNLSSLPVPPLVPCAAPKPDEKQARIYVASNLLPTAASDALPMLTGGTSVRGRPYGAKRSGNAKPRKSPGSGDAQMGGKCTVNGCVFRFKSPATLDYHRRCHNGAVNSAQPMVCPECHSSEFSNWNSLHTHLWRTHQIDMELYCCPLCTFKTPIYSRLVNTHSKIHSDERNYKCEQCGKAFKNTKQLKNHRRLHRTQGLGQSKLNAAAAGGSATAELVASLHRCEDCGAAFMHLKTLREHLCKQRSERAQCEVCQRVCSSRSSLKLHMQTHQAIKRFKCEECDYETNDHNAFRRHRATHRQQKMYACPHCDYEAIQSTAFQVHVQQKHPEQASALLHKCSVCSYCTVNPGLLLVHQAKHETPVSPDDQAESDQSTIKVESSVLLAHSSSGAKELDGGNLLHVTLVPQEDQQVS